MFPIKPKVQPRENKAKCKIIIRKKGDIIEKSIEGDCSKDQLNLVSKKSIS